MADNYEMNVKFETSSDYFERMEKMLEIINRNINNCAHMTYHINTIDDKTIEIDINATNLSELLVFALKRQVESVSYSLGFDNGKDVRIRVSYDVTKI